MIQDVVVVIRTHHERTVELCRELVAKQVPESCIYVIEEKPFVRAVKKTFEIGGQHAQPYLLALDADILLFPDAVKYMCWQAQKNSSLDYLRLDFPLLDRFQGPILGAHFYRNQYTNDLFAFMNNDPSSEKYLRGEGDNVINFCKYKGIPCQGPRPYFLVGKHDHFQSYQDIYKTYRTRRRRALADRKLPSFFKKT